MKRLHMLTLLLCFLGGSQLDAAKPTKPTKKTLKRKPAKISGNSKRIVKSGSKSPKGPRKTSAPTPPPSSPVPTNQLNKVAQEAANLAVAKVEKQIEKDIKQEINASRSNIEKITNRKSKEAEDIIKSSPTDRKQVMSDLKRSSQDLKSIDSKIEKVLREKMLAHEKETNSWKILKEAIGSRLKNDPNANVNALTKKAASHETAILKLEQEIKLLDPKFKGTDKKVIGLISQGEFDAARALAAEADLKAKKIAHIRKDLDEINMKQRDLTKQIVQAKFLDDKEKAANLQISIDQYSQMREKLAKDHSLQLKDIEMPEITSQERDAWQNEVRK